MQKEQHLSATISAMSLSSTNACRCMHVFQHDPKASIRRPGRIEAWFGQRTLQPPGLKEQLAFPRRWGMQKDLNQLSYMCLPCDKAGLKSVQAELLNLDFMTQGSQAAGPPQSQPHGPGHLGMGQSVPVGL